MKTKHETLFGPLVKTSGSQPLACKSVVPLLFLLFIGLLALPGSVRGSNIVWTNGSGDWFTAANWSPNTVPGPADHAFITNSGSYVTVNTATNVGYLTLSDGTLTGTGTLAVFFEMTWTGGTMSGSGVTIIDSSGTLNIDSTSTVILEERWLLNLGVVNWTGANPLYLQSGALIENWVGAEFWADGASLQYNGGTQVQFSNDGTFGRVGSSSGTTTVSGINNFLFINQDSVEVLDGTLVLDCTFNNYGAVELSANTTLQMPQNGSASGTFFAPATALVEWTDNTFSLNPGVTLDGAGVYRETGGILTCNTDISVRNFDLVAGFSAGGLNGSGTLTVSNEMNWIGGAMSGSGRTVIAAGAILNADSATNLFIEERTLENVGTVYWTGATPIYLTSGAVISNQVGALFEAQNDAELHYNGGTAVRFDNAGTVRKSSGTGSTTVFGNNNFVFNNYGTGTIELQTGTLLLGCTFNTGGAVELSANTTNRMSNNGSASGTFTAPATALVEWTDGTYILDSGVILDGDGDYREYGGTLTCNTDISVRNFELIAGFYGAGLNGSGTLTVSNEMNWIGGTMSGNGRTLIAGGATLNVDSATNLFIEQRTLENAGTAYWTGATPIYLTEGAVISNRVGALFEAQNDAELHYNGGTAVRFDNAGTFRKNGTTGTTTMSSSMPFNNYGSVEILSGVLAANGGYNSSSDALLSCALGGTTAGTGYGQLQVAGTVTVQGSLSVSLTNDFYPQETDTFTVLTAGTRSGTFANFYHPSNDIPMVLSNSPIEVIVLVTNAPPVAHDITLGAAFDDTVTIQVIGGKFAPVDPEGHGMSVTAVGTPTSGVAGFTTSNVTYTASGSLGTNTFTYTVTDVAGGSDTKLVTVIVYDPSGFNRISPAGSSVADGIFNLSYLGIPGYSYALDWTESLAHPITWTALVTNTADASGHVLFTVTNSEPVNYFRTHYVP